MGFARRRWIINWFTMTLFPRRRWLLWYTSFLCFAIPSVCKPHRPPLARKALSRSKLKRQQLWRIHDQSRAQTLSKQTARRFPSFYSNYYPKLAGHRRNLQNVLAYRLQRSAVLWITETVETENSISNSTWLLDFLLALKWVKKGYFYYWGQLIRLSSAHWITGRPSWCLFPDWRKRRNALKRLKNEIIQNTVISDCTGMTVFFVIRPKDFPL